ncbi:MAG: hypothetical protein NC920_00870 [Candidatus Omnitrophica bacterium]|nr:hypothetical protein [Candidatus Omnitrophota bacterium]
MGKRIILLVFLGKIGLNIEGGEFLYKLPLPPQFVCRRIKFLNMDLEKFKTIFHKKENQEFIIKNHHLPEELKEFLKNLSQQSLFNISNWLADQIDLRKEKSKNPLEVHASVIALERIIKFYLLPNPTLQFEEEFGEKVFSLIKEDFPDSRFFNIGENGIYVLKEALPHFKENLREKFATFILGFLFHPNPTLRKIAQAYILIDEVNQFVGEKMENLLAILISARMPEERVYFTIKGKEIPLSRNISQPEVDIWNLKSKLEEILNSGFTGEKALKILGLNFNNARTLEYIKNIFSTSQEKEFLRKIIEFMGKLEPPTKQEKFNEASEVYDTAEGLLPYLRNWALKAELIQLSIPPLAELLLSGKSEQIQMVIKELEEANPSEYEEYEEVIIRAKEALEYFFLRAHFWGEAIERKELEADWEKEKEFLAQTIIKLKNVPGVRESLSLLKTHPHSLFHSLFLQGGSPNWIQQLAERAYTLAYEQSGK